MFHFEIGRAADSWGFKSLGSGGGCPPTDSILVIDETWYKAGSMPVPQRLLKRLRLQLDPALHDPDYSVRL